MQELKSQVASGQQAQQTQQTQQFYQLQEQQWDDPEVARQAEMLKGQGRIVINQIRAELRALGLSAEAMKYAEDRIKATAPETVATADAANIADQLATFAEGHVKRTARPAEPDAAASGAKVDKAAGIEDAIRADFKGVSEDHLQAMAADPDIRKAYLTGHDDGGEG